MTESMRGKRILVVEDEYLLADDLRTALQDVGSEVVGPVPDAAGALALIDGPGRIDAALLDINLSGTPAFSVADALVGRGVPIAFITGYDQSAIPDRLANVARLEKPVGVPSILALLEPLLAG